MAPSRTLVEQTAETAVESRGEDMDFSSSSEVSSDDVVETGGKRTSKTIDPAAYKVEIDPSRDALLTDFGKETLNDRYLHHIDEEEAENFPDYAKYLTAEDQQYMREVFERRKQAECAEAEVTPELLEEAKA